ncbi:MAG: hypothetical protein B7Z37_22730 [Verrucomicrobia bacterium 12-59-8]|nr:MAG: hypothetical protein B7Z37_22730 [Verrucomicrobia bacterium 12-59-8]
MSPFSIAGATPTNAPLTVGDVIYQLPPEVVRMGALPAEQPLSLPPALLENALRSGQAALPVFELYRVCPALFQVPISPQDPRLVALPATKLPGLIAQAREGGSGTSAPAMAASHSPFSLAQPAAAAPFSLAQPTPTPHSPAGSPFQMIPPATEPATPPPQPFQLRQFAAPGFAPPMPKAESAAPASPFSLAQPAPQQAPAPAAGSPFSFGPASNGSPFGVSSQPPAEAGGSAPAASPFSLGGSSLGGSPNGSPFGMASQPAAAEQRPATTLPPQVSISNLFTPQAQQRASTPSDMATSPSLPFGSPFVAAMKEAAPQAQSPTPEAWAAQSPAPAPAAAPGNAAAASGMVKLGFATVLSGYSVEELGFNPTTLPAWISTSVQASTLQEQISSGNIVVELGMLIDGISDLGFRNTLNNAKRDFKIKLPQNEVFHALSNAPAAPAVAAPRPAAQPATFNAQPMFTIPAAPGPETAQHSGASLNPFAQSQPAAAPAASPPPFGAAPPSNGPMPFAFIPPAPLPALGSAQPSSGPSQFAFAPPAPAEPSMLQPSPVASSPFGSAQQSAAPSSPPSAPLQQPLAGAFQAFGSMPSLAGAQPGSTPAGAAKSFDPFASSSTGPLSAKTPAESGFSSAQLLGQAPAPQQPAATAFAPAPESMPAARLFAASEIKPATTSLFAASAPALFQPTPSFAPALEEIPSFSQPAAPAPQPAARGLFSTQPASKPLFAEPATPQIKPEYKPAPVPAAAQAKMAAVKHSFLGLAPLDTQTDQLLLRALLGTEEKLTAPRVVELLALQQGLSACVCLHGSHVLSHADSSKADALEFQRQAPDIARQLRGLAPLIGIEGAETFTLNAGGRLLTFCFPGDSIIGVLHDDEPSTGMRDKITLIARELARMLD